MRKLLSLVALACCFTSANAAGVYVLTDVSSYNAFTTYAPSSLTGPVSGTATVDGVGNVTITGLSFSTNAFGQNFTYTGGNWSTTVGGTSITNSGVCTDIAGASCADPFGGLAPLAGGTTAVFGNGSRNTGAPSVACPPIAGTLIGPTCDLVSVVETPGVSLVITEQSEFIAIAGTPSGYVYTFTVVPVPAAVWLFGSALGLLGWIRRRSV